MHALHPALSGPAAVGCGVERGDPRPVDGRARTPSRRAERRAARRVLAAPRRAGPGPARGRHDRGLACLGGRPDEVEDADVAPRVQEPVDVRVIRACAQAVEVAIDRLNCVDVVDDPVDAVHDEHAVEEPYVVAGHPAASLLGYAFTFTDVTSVR